MELGDLIEEYVACKLCQDEVRTNQLLCDVVKYILENEWFFLLDIIYPYEMEYPTDIRLGNLVIGHAPPEDGFSLIKSLPVRDILEGNIKSEEIRQEEKMEYIRNTLPLIPYKELI